MTQTTSERTAETVDFGPDQGAITALNLRPMQVAIGAFGLLPLWAATAAKNLPVMAAVGFLVTLPCFLAAVLRVPLTGKYLDQIIGPWLRWRWWKLTGKHKRQPITSYHWLGDRLAEPDQAPPPELAQVRLVAHTDAHSRKVGLVYDRDQRTYTVVMRIEASQPGIGGFDHLDRTLRDWQHVLQGAASREGGIRRFQWLLVAAPDDGTRLHADYQLRAVVQDGPLAEMYEDLVERADPTGTTHETYLAVQVDERPANDEDWVNGGAYAASARAAKAAAKNIADSLVSTNYRVVKEALEPGELGRLIHLLYAPQQRTHIEQTTGDVPYEFVWPKQTTRPWECYVTDAAMHRVWELKWPKLPVQAAFLDNLSPLYGTAYALSVVYQPLEAEDEEAKGENKRSGAVVKDETRSRWGFMKRRKTEHQEDKNEGYLAEVLAGFEPFRVTAWVLVSASASLEDMQDPDNYIPIQEQAVFSSSRAVRRRMEAGEAGLKRAARLARVTLVPRDGVHAQAMTHVLPFCRGTEGAWL